MSRYTLTPEMRSDIATIAINFGNVGYEFQHADWYDPWGCAMGWAFALNDLLAMQGGQTDPTYRMAMGGADTDAYEFQMLVEANLTIEQLETAQVTISRLLDSFKDAGWDY